MGSLQLPFFLDSYEPKNKSGLWVTPTCVNRCGFSVIHVNFKLNSVQGARFDSELVVDGSVPVDNDSSVVESLKNGLLSGKLVDSDPNLESLPHSRARGRNIWRRFRGVRKTKEGIEDLRVSANGHSDNELDVSVYGVGIESSSENCNRVLKVLEKGSSNNKAIKFFEWMRCNGKLEGNVTAYILALRVLGRKGDWGSAEKLIVEMRCESGCDYDFRVFNSIIYACSKMGFVDVGTKWFHMMLAYNVQPNIATFGMIMSLCQKSWNVEEAEFVFSEMRKLNVKCQSAYSSMITIYTRLGLHTKAEEVINFLFKDEIVPNLENWLVMLNAYSQQGKLDEAKSILVSMQEIGFRPNIVAYNTLITGYGKISDADAAEHMFLSLPIIGLDPDETTYRSMIEGWSRSGNYEKAKWYYESLKSRCFKPNSSNLYSLINLQAKHNDTDGAIISVNDMVEMGCQPSSILASLIQAYEKAGKFDAMPLIMKSSIYKLVVINQTASSILAMAYVKHSLAEEAIKLLQDKQWKDPVFEDNLYHLLICSCKELGHLESAVEIFTRMPNAYDKPNVHILSTMIDVYSIMNRFSDADKTYQFLKSSRVVMDLIAYSIVVRMYIKAGNLKDACCVLDDMDTHATIIPDVYLLRDMLRLYQKCNKKDKLSDLYYKILKTGVTWDQEMYNCIINCCAHALPIDELSRVFDEMIQRGFTPNTFTYNVMIDVYGKSRLFKKARKVFWMAKKQGLVDVISYNTLIAAYGQSENFRKMTKTVKMMQFNGFSVSLEAYNSMLDAYGKVRQMEEFKSVLEKLKESDCSSDQYTYNILMNIYGEHGWIEEVAEVLGELKEYGPGLDLCSYNTLIKAYGIAGMVENAVAVIKEMREHGINPEKSTYVNLIKALQRNDKFLEAVRWSLWMKQIGLS